MLTILFFVMFCIVQDCLPTAALHVLPDAETRVEVTDEVLVLLSIEKYTCKS